MKYAFLVAWREYAENAKTKGFWIGLFLMPAILFLSAQVPIWLEERRRQPVLSSWWTSRGVSHPLLNQAWKGPTSRRSSARSTITLENTRPLKLVPPAANPRRIH